MTREAGMGPVIGGADSGGQPAGSTQGGPSPQHEPGGWFYAWWQDDPLPPLAVPPGFAARPAAEDDVALLSRLSGEPPGRLLERQRTGHRAYLAHVRGEPVGYGWSAARSATIGELGISLTLAPGERYLWDFATVPAWRGRGVYPGLLRAVLAGECSDGARCLWIGHGPDNRASARGIQKAGFAPVGELHIAMDGRRVLRTFGPPRRAQRGAELLGIPAVTRRPPGA